MSEVVLAASQCRTTISETVQSLNPGVTVADGAFGCEATNPTKYVSAIETNGATGVVTVKPVANFGSVTFAPATDFLTLTPYVLVGGTATALSLAASGGHQGQQVSEWRCAGSTDAIKKYLPGSCK
jgi:type IV pilus assembly protein PilA